MITGRVNSDREPVIRLDLRGPTGRRKRIEAVVDTGYNGTLTLPRALVTRLELRWRSYSWTELADDSKSFFDVYAARVHWDGAWRSIEVDCSGSTPLVGMELLDGYELRVEASIGGDVSIDAMR